MIFLQRNLGHGRRQQLGGGGGGAHRVVVDGIRVNNTAQNNRIVIRSLPTVGSAAPWHQGLPFTGMWVPGNLVGQGLGNLKVVHTTKFVVYIPLDLSAV